MLEKITFTVVASCNANTTTADLVVTERGDFPAPAGEHSEDRMAAYTEDELQEICKAVASRNGAFEHVRFDLMRKLTPLYSGPASARGLP